MFFCLLTLSLSFLTTTHFVAASQLTESQCSEDVALVSFRFHRSVFVSLNASSHSADPDGALVDVLLTMNSLSLFESGQPFSTHCTDIRFVHSSDSTPIPYFIESGCLTPYFQVWIQLNTSFGVVDVHGRYLNFNISFYFGHRTGIDCSAVMMGSFFSLVARSAGFSGGKLCDSGWLPGTEEGIADLSDRFLRIGSEANSFGTINSAGETPYDHQHNTGRFLQTSGGADPIYSEQVGADGPQFGVAVAGMGHWHYPPEPSSHTMEPPAYVTVGLCLSVPTASLRWLPIGTVIPMLDVAAANATISRTNSSTSSNRSWKDWTVDNPMMEDRFLRVVLEQSFDEVLSVGGANEHRHEIAPVVRNDIKSGSLEYACSTGGGTKFPPQNHIHNFTGPQYTAYADSRSKWLNIGALRSENLESFFPGMILFVSELPPLGWVGLQTLGHPVNLYLQMASLASGTIGDSSNSKNHNHGLTSIYLNEPIEDDWISVDTGDCGNGLKFQSEFHNHSSSPMDLFSRDSLTNLPYFDIFAVQRKESAALSVVFGEIVQDYFECDGVGFYLTGEVCGGKGTCESQDNCSCTRPFYGENCGVAISKGAYDSPSLVSVPYQVNRFSLPDSWVVLSEDDMNSETIRTDCQSVLTSVSSSSELEGDVVSNCQFRLKGLLVQSFEFTASVRTISEVSLLTPILREVDVEIVAFVEDESGSAAIYYAVGFGVGGLFLIVVLVVVVVLAVVIVWNRHFKKGKERIETILTLEDYDILLAEQKARERGEKAALNINMDCFKIEYDSIVLKEVIAQGGGSAEVYLAEWNGMTVAFKQFRLKTFAGQIQQDVLSEFEREVSVMANLRHPNILQFYGATVKIPRIGIVLEYCSAGDLQNWLLHHPKEDDFPFRDRLRLLLELASAMSFLHSQLVFHRDLKPQNVLLVEGTGGVSSRVMDFGLSKIQKRGSSAQHTVRVILVALTVLFFIQKRIGTSLYMSPEVVLHSTYDMKCDVFSYGILSYVVLTSIVEPYPEQWMSSIELRVAQDPSMRPSLRELSRRGVPSWAISWVIGMWQHDPRNRPTMEEIGEGLKARAFFEGSGTAILSDSAE